MAAGDEWDLNAPPTVAQHAPTPVDVSDAGLEHSLSSLQTNAVASSGLGETLSRLDGEQSYDSATVRLLVVLAAVSILLFIAGVVYAVVL